MTKEIFIYDKSGLELLTCQFAGVSEDGRPQLVITTPGKAVQSLDDYTCHKKDYLMLCESEKKAESRVVLRMLACVYEGGCVDLEDGVKGRVEDMRCLGIDWDRKPVVISAHVSEYMDEDDVKRFNLWLSEGKYDSSIIAEIIAYPSIDDLFDELRVFLTLVEETTGIRLISHLTIRKPLEEKIRKEDLNLFSYIKVKN